jgi:hypothetical protein
MRKLAVLLLATILLAACGGQQSQFEKDMSEVRALVQTAYDDGMRTFTEQEHAAGLRLVSVERHDFDIYSDEHAILFDHFMLFVNYADFSRGDGDADFLDTLDKYATK